MSRRGVVAEIETIERRLIDVNQMADYTGLAVKTIYSMVSKRRIPFVKLGRLTKFDVREVDTWIKKNAVKAQAPSA
jgi:excisionase family DNA binding protein